MSSPEWFLISFHQNAVLHTGDVSYADGYQPRWDSFGRMFSPVASSVAVMVAGGDHENCHGEAWLAFSNRYPMPYRPSGSLSQQYFSFDAGPCHVLSLASFASWQPGSPQRCWLEADLRAYAPRRNATPWLLVMVHVPLLCSNASHQGEGTAMLRDLGALLIDEARCDMLLSGHVHAYERVIAFSGAADAAAALPAADATCLGAVVGNGGNREGQAKHWAKMYGT